MLGLQVGLGRSDLDMPINFSNLTPPPSPRYLVVVEVTYELG